MNNFSNPLSFNHRVAKLQTYQRKQRKYHNLKWPNEGTTWKNFAISRPRNISLEDLNRTSSKTSGRGWQTPGYYQAQDYEQTNRRSMISQRRARQQSLRLSGMAYSNKRQQHEARLKQDAIRRVKMLQQKVMPLLSQQKHHTYNQHQQYGLAWQLKMQQRLVKIQNSIQKIKNQFEIKYQKRLMDVERQWEQRIAGLLEFLSSVDGQTVNGEAIMYGGNGETLIYGENGEAVRYGGDGQAVIYTGDDQEELVDQNNGRYEQYDQINERHYRMEGQEETVNGNNRYA